jgi:hypothetical protein
MDASGPSRPFHPHLVYIWCFVSKVVASKVKDDASVPPCAGVVATQVLQPWGQLFSDGDG